MKIVVNYIPFAFYFHNNSCVDTGMRDRQPRDNHDGGDNTDRLYRLQSFQLTLLRFALTRCGSSSISDRIVSAL